MKFGLGQSAPRVEDQRLLTGRGRYTDDHDVPGQAHAVVVRSPYPHARIRGIDRSAALDAPGVVVISEILPCTLERQSNGCKMHDARRKMQDARHKIQDARNAALIRAPGWVGGS